METTDIIIPIWKKNSKEEIIRSLDSIINQKEFVNNIYIVIDGCEEFPIYLPFEHNLKDKITFIYLYKNSGPGVARNIGVIFAKSKNIIFLDAGDKCSKNRIALQINSLINNDISVGNILEIDKKNNKSSVRISASNKINANRILPYRTPFNNVTIAIKRTIFMELGGYPDLRTAEDWLFMGKVLKSNLKISYEKDILVEINKDDFFIYRRKGKLVYNDIKSCIKELNKIGLINKFEMYLSLNLQRVLRLYTPKIILGSIYTLLRKQIN